MPANSISIVEVASNSSGVDVVEVGSDSGIQIVQINQGPAGSAATVDQTIIDGSTNAVAGNAVFDALALKAPLASPTFTGTVTAPHIHGSIAGNLYVHVRNTSGGTLTKGTPLYITGNVGTAGNEDRVTVAAADNTNPAKMPAVALLGSDLANNGDGNGIIVGELTNLNIPSYSINQELYVGAGAIATTKPTTGEVQSVGVVARINTNTGIIVVNMQGRMTRDGAFATAAQIIDADIVKKVQLKNTRIKLAARETAGSGVPAAAINIMVFGDSVSNSIAVESPLPGQDLVGYKLDQRSSVTAGTAPAVGGSNEWLQGRYRNASIGATIQYAPSTAGTIDFRANRIGVGFITGPTGATFDLEFQLGSGSWTVAASGISTYSASAGGNYLTYTITNAALETVKVRVTNVVAGSGGGGATAKIIGCGFWLENFGGYVISRCDDGGLDNAFISTCPAATVSGVVAGLLPDIVMGSWLDTPAGWDEGGTYDTLYDKIKAGRSTCDFLLIGPPPQTDSYYTTYGDQDATMDAWATRNNESYISTKRMFRSWAAGVADGYLVGGVDVHMTTAGYQMRNYLIEQIVEAAIGRNGGSILRISRRAIMRQSNTTNGKIWIGQGLQNNEAQGGIYLPGGNAFNSIQLGSTSSFVPANSLHCSFSGTIDGQDGELKWFPDATVVTWMSFAVSSGSAATGKITQSSSWPLRIKMKRSTGADPTDGEVAAEHGIIFMRRNGSSKMEFCAKFPSGVVQIIATEP
jgi:hypothetical protein